MNPIHPYSRALPHTSSPGPPPPASQPAQNIVTNTQKPTTGYDYPSNGHAFEIDSGGYVLVEGSVFQNVPVVLDSGVAGLYFTSPSTSANAACTAYLGRACQVNGFGSSGTFSGATTSFFSDFSGKTVASAETYSWVQSNVISNAGIGIVD